jgi:hypothetical protein
VTAPHSHRQVRCRPHEQAIDPTSMRPGRSRWPRGQCSGGRTIHDPSVPRTSSPTAGMIQAYWQCDEAVSGRELAVLVVQLRETMREIDGLAPLAEPSPADTIAARHEERQRRGKTLSPAHQHHLERSAGG